LIDLNDIKKIREIDSLGSLITTENYDVQFREGFELGKSFEIKNPGREFHELVLLGTGGGSSVAGGLLRSYLFDELKIPVIINQGYDVPAFVDGDSLVFVVSHSGNTEETLSAYEQAKKRGAYMVAITSGGRLEEICRRDGVPTLIVPYDIGHPRRDLGYILVPMLLILTKLGMISDKTGDVEDLIELFSVLKERYRAETPVEKNLAKQVAISLYGYIPLIYGSLDFYDSVAWRIKNQFGENSKLMAFYNVIPSLHHDEAVGWDMPKELLKKFHLLLLRDDKLDSGKIKKRKNISVDILKDRVGKITELYAEGNTRLSRMFSLVYLGDFITLYTAIYRGVDPTPVDVINLFKKKMAE
jgi:glucose/mannose-6-phosphate isomerase